VQCRSKTGSSRFGQGIRTGAALLRRKNVTACLPVSSPANPPTPHLPLHRWVPRRGRDGVPGKQPKLSQNGGSNPLDRQLLYAKTASERSTAAGGSESAPPRPRRDRWPGCCCRTPGRASPRQIGDGMLHGSGDVISCRRPSFLRLFRHGKRMELSAWDW
jgi:hypothetical protein